MKARWSWVSLPLLTLLAACNAILGYGDFVKIDGESGGDGGGNVGTDPTTTPTTNPTTVPTTPPTVTCVPTKAWGVPAPIPSFTGFLPSLSGDELTLAWEGPGDAIFLAQRPTIGGAYGAQVQATGLMTTNSLGPSFSADGLTLFWYALSSTNTYNVFIATRASTTATAFTGTRALASHGSETLDSINPVVSRDGNELFTVRVAARSTQPQEIWHALKSGTDFAAPAQLTEIAAGVTGSVDSIALSADRLTLYFSSRRSPSLGRSDIWSVTRASTTAPFGAPTQELLQGINSAEDDLVSWISPDNCRLYFSSFRGNGNQLFVATRTP